MLQLTLLSHQGPDILYGVVDIPVIRGRLYIVVEIPVTRGHLYVVVHIPATKGHFFS